ncbi:unnamed protein product, partial [Mesorhabditis belari]|uniref:Protein kinase domain-containing protein n=1 Tax=Mesorhabditis belari TaxID=2138241 RepID=A0AAF3F031_9BILA
MATVMWWIGDLFAVIHYLKQKSLVHCDIKPSTILLDKNYVLKLSAFGNYREQEEKSRITFKSDMFSAGVTLWEMIERRSPTFSANYQIEKLQAAEKDIEEIFMSCVDEDAQKRPLPAEAQKQVSKIQKIFETVFQVTPRRRPENSSLVMPDGYDQEIVEIFKDNSSTTYWEYKSTTGMEPEAFEQLDSGYQTDSSAPKNWLQSTPKVPGKPPQSHNLVSEKVLDVALKEDFLKTALQEDLMHTEMTACLKLLESGTNWRVPFITDDFMYPEPETPGLWWSIQEDVPKFSCAGFDSFPTMLELSYEKMVIIGRGTFGDVYRLKGMDDVSIAVKIFVYEHISWTDEVYRNLNAIKNLKDSNLVEYFEVSDRYVEGGRIYFGIFMEYFEYGDLLKFIMKPSWVYMMVNVFEWAVHLFSAISFLEQHQLIHWNIKTSNVLMGKSFILKLGGFEMIESFDKADLQRSKGTERYMSPEVLFGPKFSEKSHVWAVGLTLWETIQRRCIFTKPSEFQGYMTPSSLTDLKEQVILELETLSCLDDFKRIIERCLDLEPSSRIEANDALQKSLEIKKRIDGCCQGKDGPMELVPMMGKLGAQISTSIHC